MVATMPKRQPLNARRIVKPCWNRKAESSPALSEQTPHDPITVLICQGRQQLIQTSIQPTAEPFGIAEPDREQQGGGDHQGLLVCRHGSRLSSALRVPRSPGFADAEQGPQQSRTSAETRRRRVVVQRAAAASKSVPACNANVSRQVG
jgi:hypothetical protein